MASPLKKARQFETARPCDMAVDKMAILLGPGLATPMAYATNATGMAGEMSSDDIDAPGRMWVD